MPGYLNNDGSELVGGMLPNGSGQAIQLDSAGNLKTSLIQASPVNSSATGDATHSAVATLPGVANKTTYISGFTMTTTAPASAVNGVATIAGLLGGTMYYQVQESTAQGFQLTIIFAQPIPASAQNTAIYVTIPAIAGGGLTAVAAYGFQQ